jgi:hypothetical protein
VAPRRREFGRAEDDQTSEHPRQLAMLVRSFLLKAIRSGFHAEPLACRLRMRSKLIENSSTRGAVVGTRRRTRPNRGSTTRRMFE